MPQVPPTEREIAERFAKNNCILILDLADLQKEIDSLPEGCGFFYLTNESLNANEPQIHFIGNFPELAHPSYPSLTEGSCLFKDHLTGRNLSFREVIEQTVPKDVKLKAPLGHHFYKA